jgi:hypothetical protein
MDDKIIDLIDQATPESALADRVKLAALTWRASKLAPKKYGNCRYVRAFRTLLSF